MSNIEYWPKGCRPPANVGGGRPPAIASIWSEAPLGLWVVPLDGGPRRIIYVKKIRSAYEERDG